MKLLLMASAALLASACTNLSPQPRVTTAPKIADERLYAEIARMDKAMFDAFNAHDIEGVMALFSEDLEFYHDRGGLLRYKDAFDGMKSNFDKNNGLRRDLIPGTMEVYPINNYGAVEIGAHRFCHVENGKDDCGDFKFVHVWRKSGDQWKVTRVVSYDH